MIWAELYGQYRMDIGVGDNFGDVDSSESKGQTEKNGKCQQRKWPNRSCSNDH